MNQYSGKTVVGETTLIELSLDESMFSLNKQFSIDSFIHWEGHHWTFCAYPHTQRSLSSDHSTPLANMLLVD